MAQEDILGVALVHYACPICGKPMENHSAILMNEILTKTRADAVNKLNGKCIGFCNTACDECASHKDECVYIIEIDEEQSTPTSPYRTGKYWGIVEDWPLFIDHPEFILETDNGVKYCFMTEELTHKFGFYEDNRVKG